MKLITLVVLALYSFCVCIAVAQDVSQATAAEGEPVIDRPLTLEEAITLALENQPALALSQSQVESARSRVARAKSSYFPQLFAGYDYSDSISPFRTDSGRFLNVSKSSVTQVGLQQMLFDTGKRELNVSVSRISQRGAELGYLDTRLDVILNVTLSYYEALRQKELVRVAESGVERSYTTLEATRAFADAGTGPRKDILQAEADYHNSQIDLIQARNNVRIALISLKNAIGVSAPEYVDAAPVNLAPPPPEADTLGSSAYVARAIENRPDLRQQLTFIEADRQSVRVARINAGLQVETNVTQGYRVHPDPGENRAFIFSLSYPLFDGGSRRADVRDAKEQLRRSEVQLKQAHQSVQLDVGQNYLLREEARSRYSVAQIGLRAARLNFEAATESQKEGAGSIIDVITARSQLVVAETNAVQALYDFYVSDARLRRAIGANDPYLASGDTK